MYNLQESPLFFFRYTVIKSSLDARCMSQANEIGPFLRIDPFPQGSLSNIVTVENQIKTICTEP